MSNSVDYRENVIRYSAQMLKAADEFIAAELSAKHPGLDISVREGRDFTAEATALYDRELARLVALQCDKAIKARAAE